MGLVGFLGGLGRRITYGILPEFFGGLRRFCQMLRLQVDKTILLYLDMRKQRNKGFSEVVIDNLAVAAFRCHSNHCLLTFVYLRCQSIGPFQKFLKASHQPLHVS